ARIDPPPHRGAPVPGLRGGHHRLRRPADRPGQRGQRHRGAGGQRRAAPAHHGEARARRVALRAVPEVPAGHGDAGSRRLVLLGRVGELAAVRRPARHDRAGARLPGDHAARRPGHRRPGRGLPRPLDRRRPAPPGHGVLLHAVVLARDAAHPARRGQPRAAADLRPPARRRELRPHDELRPGRRDHPGPPGPDLAVAAAPHPAGDHRGADHGGLRDAHDARVVRRHDERGLRPDGADEGDDRAPGVLAAHLPQLGAADPHDRRHPVRRAARRRRGHRGRVRLPRRRAAARRRHLPARLPHRAGRGARRGVPLHPREHPDGHLLPVPRPPDAPAV
ncbi:MAG: Dipeptide transport system permease protein DppB, partial [uncultured Solirubrobacteraceae bacterium]